MSLPPYPAPVRARIDRHLDEIGRALEQTGASASERAAVRADVASHIDEQLTALPADQRTLAAVEACLASLDAPTVFAAASAQRATSAAASDTRGRRLLGALALISAVLGLALPLIAVAVAQVGDGAYVAFFAAQLLAIALGIAARRDALGKAAALAGAVLLLSSLVLGALFR